MTQSTQSAQFDTIALSGHRTVVRGTDKFGSKGETVIDSQQWEEIEAAAQHSDAHEAFDEAVNDFFAPLLGKLDKLQEQRVASATDPFDTLVVREPVEATPGDRGQVYDLNPGSKVLALIQAGQSDRLVWVAGSLEVLAYVPPVVPSSEDSSDEDGPSVIAGGTNIVLSDS